MSELTNYEQTLLTGWESTYKMGQLGLWLMLSLKDSPKHMAEIKEFISDVTDGNLTADDKSVYRALRKYFDAELVGFVMKPSVSGPDLKVYNLTEIGSRVLGAFLDRNIRVFYDTSIRNLIEKG